MRREFIFRAWTETNPDAAMVLPNPAWGIKAHSAAMANGVAESPCCLLKATVCRCRYISRGYTTVTTCFTWRWIAGDESIETLVTVDLVTYRPKPPN